MRYLLNREDSRRADTYTIETLGIPGMVLMEKAGEAVSETVLDILTERNGYTVYVLCGKGNNGGDGFVVARHMLEHGLNPIVFHTANQEEYTGDAATNLNILTRLTDQTYYCPNLNTLEDTTRDLFNADVIVDGLLGTGITGTPRPPYDEFIEWINSYNAPTVAIDIPSGIDANSGQAQGVAVSAVATVTMGFAKCGLLFSPGRDLCGNLYIADIGIPSQALDHVEHIYNLPQEDDILYRLPLRNSDLYKHRAGKVFTLCGARGFTGAAAMVSESALLAGAGLVLAGVPKSLNNILESKMTEVITVPLPESTTGTFSGAAYDDVQDYYEWADVFAIGSGLSRKPAAMNLTKSVLTSFPSSVIVDADATAIFADNLDLIHECPGNLIFTPHWGEYSHMTGTSIKDLTDNRIDIAKSFAEEYGVTLVLKGAPSIIASYNGVVVVNPTGNAGMATAGSGDVLTGILAGLVAQGLSPIDATMTGCYLHGLAGDLARDEYTEYALTATDIMTFYPDALRMVMEYYDQ